MQSHSLPIAATDGIPVYQSLIRPEQNMLLGADRILIIGLGVIVGIFILALKWTVLSLSVSAVLLLIGYPILRRLYKYDPYWRPIMLRHIKFQSFYPATAHPSAPRPSLIPSVPTIQECK